MRHMTMKLRLQVITSSGNGLSPFQPQATEIWHYEFDPQDHISIEL